MSYESKIPVVNDNPAFTAICDTDDRALWLRERRKYIGASDASAILGVIRGWVRRRRSEGHPARLALG